MHIYDRPNGQQVICAGGQNGDVILAIYDQGTTRQNLVQETLLNTCIMML